MKLRGRVEYTLTNQSGDVFDAALNAGFEAVADGEKIYFSLSDASGNYAEVEGRISNSGTTFTREELHVTDHVDGVSLPTFDASVTARSAFPAWLTERSFGEAALVAIGDETLVGYTNGGYDAEKDLIDSDILQTRYNWRDSADTLTTVDDVVVAGYPLYHGKQYAVASSISPLNAMAKVLKNKCGFKSIRIIPATEGAVDFTSFEQAGANYTRLLTMLTDFLSDESNQIACFVVSVGRQEGKAALIEATMAGRLDALRTNLIADVLVATSVDITNVPFVYVDFADNFMTNFAAAAPVQAAILDTPARQSRAAVISGTGLATTGTEDYSAQGSRDLAALLASAYTATLKPVVTAEPPLETGDFGDDLILVNTADTGITVDGSGNLTGWADLSVSGVDSYQSDVAHLPEYLGPGLGVTCISNTGCFEINPAVFNDARGFTLTMDYYSNTGAGFNVMGGSTDTPASGAFNLLNILNFGTLAQKIYLPGKVATIPNTALIMSATRKIITISYDAVTGEIKIWFGLTLMYTVTVAGGAVGANYFVIGSNRVDGGGYQASAPITVFGLAALGRPIIDAELADLHAYVV